MNTKVNAYNDAASKRFVSMFRDALAPVIAAICPGHLLHHINLLRGIPCRLDRDTFLHLAGDETPN